MRLYQGMFLHFIYFPVLEYCNRRYRNARIFASQASSQWRKVQHRLEADERCLRLEKMERLEIFQVRLIYISIKFKYHWHENVIRYDWLLFLTWHVSGIH